MRYHTAAWLLPAIVCLLPALFCLRIQAQTVPPPSAAIPPAAALYLGEPRPGVAPRLFARGKVSDGMADRDMAISPRGDELLYTVQSANGQVSVVLWWRYRNGKWEGPEMAPFAGRYADLEPVFSAGGDTLYFASNRPVKEGGALKDFDIWMVRREKGGWGSPVRLDTVINTSRDEFYPSIARNGNLYFTRVMENGKGKEDIVVSEWKDGRYQAPYSLPEAINTDKFEFNAFVDPDERFVLFSSFGRADDVGGGDLYCSVRGDHGEWLPAVHLDTTINSKSLDFSPFVTPDGRYLFFTSEAMKRTPPYTTPLTFSALKDLLGNPGNGMNDIYWMEWKPLLDRIRAVRR